MKGKLRASDERVARQYGGRLFRIEATRLESMSPIEFEMTKRVLARVVPRGATVAEIGVGVGHYSEFLARRGCRVHLVDVTERFLDAATRRLERAGLGRRVAGTTHASATKLVGLAARSFDVVLMLGPLYHLRSPAERRAAVRQAARVLRPRGMLVAAGINRLAYLRDAFRDDLPSHVPGPPRMRAWTLRRFHARYLRDGNVDPTHTPPIGWAHFARIEEFLELFRGAFEPIDLRGLESFAAPWQWRLAKLPPRERRAWLDLVERTSTWVEAFGVADHWLFTGRKRARR